VRGAGHPPTTTTTTTTPVTGPSTTVNVGMFEYRFDLSQTTIPSGNVTFVITNNGTEPHNCDIAGVRAGAIFASVRRRRGPWGPPEDVHSP
jgi:hypothetical protein